MGIPVLTTPHVGASDLIQPGINGFLANPKQTDAFVRAIRDTLALGVRDYSFSVADTSLIFEGYYRIARGVLAEKSAR
jgi:glycosyltransferase involved in cell wall biosynthesis